MGDLSEMLRDGYAAHERALGASAGAGLTGRAVRDVRTRRAWRAGATGAVAAVSVGAVAAGAWGVGGAGLFGASGGPASGGFQPAGCWAYYPPNTQVLPPDYVGRAYVDIAGGLVVAVTPDGTSAEVQADSNGDYWFDFDGTRQLIANTADEQPWPTVWDNFASEGGGDKWVDQDLKGYEWELLPYDEAPSGVDVDGLWHVMTFTLGFSGLAYDERDVPVGARTEVIAHYDDSVDGYYELTAGSAAPRVGGQNLDGAGRGFPTEDLNSIELRVTLADGGKWSMTFLYAPENVPQLDCVAGPPSGTEPSAIADPVPSPSAGQRESSADPAAAVNGPLPLEGPESRVFACGAPLPADREDSDSATAKREPGIALSEADADGAEPDGLTFEAPGGEWPVTSQVLREAFALPGWTAYGLDPTETDMVGSVRYEQVVALRDGVIVGYAATPAGEELQPGENYRYTTSREHEGGLRFSSVYSRIDDWMVPCDAASGDDLAGTSLAVIYGFGPTLDDVTYAWTAVQE